MTQPHDIERRIEHGCRYRHLSSDPLRADPRNRMAVEGDGDVLRLHVEVEGIVAAVAPEAGIFHTSERRRQMAHVFGIDPDHAGLETSRDPMRAAEIARPDITGEPVAHVVADPDSLRLILEWDDSQHGAENLLLRNAHFGPSIEIERRLDV